MVVMVVGCQQRGGESYQISSYYSSHNYYSVLFAVDIDKKSKKAMAPLPPGPKGLPVIGYLPFLGTFLHKKFTELAGKYGSIYKLWLGNKLCIVISSPSLAKEVFRDKDAIFANRDPPTASRIASYGGNDIAWSSYGPEWKKMRKVFVREMLSNPVDFGELVFEIIANAINSMLCGGTVKGEKWISFVSEFRKLAEELMVLQGKPNVSDLFPVLARFDLQGHCGGWHRHNINHARMDDGRANATSRIMEKVYQELDEVVGHSNIVEEFHLPNLQLLNAVMKETLRLHPALPLSVPHISSQSCTLGGYTIPKGSTVFLNVNAIHKDPVLWDNALEFRPERFLNKDSGSFDYSGNNFQYLPFGSGRRICPGVPLAERMFMFIFASLLHSFEWKLLNGTEVELSDKFGIVVKKKNPLLLIAKPRLSNFDLY
ncbi:hypothetical protein GH714_029635 [Hevea brasiliensis]|uniref:Cytochrome P450 n=1 Tax=Hevea brasiliensis TaxID=3981 RepID=A0A6A6LHB3_HEVBR|nr:hypothetical protein GH714_029635 [Hevea brasiliensis]